MNFENRLNPTAVLVLSVMTLPFLVSCGGSGSSPATSKVSLVPTTAQPLVDDWTTWAHDQQHTGHESQQLGSSTSIVSSLKLRWTFTASDQIYASPVVSSGLVIICTANTGIVYALDATTGAVVWQRTLGGQIRATPTIADGQVFIGTHLFTVTSTGGFDPAPSSFYAIDLISGAIRWQTPVSATVRGTAALLGGRVIVGIAGGDPPTCYEGGIEAFDEASGAIDWLWKVNPRGAGGGSVWAPIATDGNLIIAGTGNTCDTPVTTANSTVALNPANGQLEWAALQQKNSALDDDTGGGALIVGGAAYDISKDGAFYSFDTASGKINFSLKLNPTDSDGGWATPTTDGSTIVISGGSYGASGSTSDNRRFFTVESRRKGLSSEGGAGKIFALGLGGETKWSVATDAQISSYVAIASGMAFANIDSKVEALDLATGAPLWSYPLNDTSQGGVAIVPSGLYTASDSGTVYAFTL